MTTSRSQFRPRRVLAGLLAATVTWCSSANAQDVYPSRPVTIIIPFTAGSQPDILARALAEHFTKVLGQSFVILNRDGAAGVIGVEALSQSKPDGYTLGYGPQGQFTIQPNLRKNMRYKVEDFEFICQSNTGAFAVVAGPTSPYNSLAELIEAARKSPGKISFASAGHATGPHLIGESLALEAGVKFNTVAGTGSLSAYTPASANLAPAGTQSYTATYTLSAADAYRAAGINIATGNGVENSATATGTPVAGTLAAVTPSTTEVAIVGVAKMSITKSWAFVAGPTGDVNGNGFADKNDLLVYTYVVTNTGGACSFKIEAQ